MSRHKPKDKDQYVEGEVLKREMGTTKKDTWNEKDGHYGKWAEVTIVKKIVDNDKENTVIFETARKYLETGKTEIHKNQTRQAKGFCVNGPEQGKYLVMNGDGSDPDYTMYNQGGYVGGNHKGKREHKSILVHTPSLPA
jgi:hypothetical protein